MRPLRSLHFVPAARSRMPERALESRADALILDLEDSVPPDAKDAARDDVCRWLERDFGEKQRIVRINALSTPWGEEDLRATAPLHPDAYMIPKVESSHDLELIDGHLRRLGRSGQIDTELIPIATETPRAVLELARIATAPRVCALTWGAEDLSAAIGATRNRDDQGNYLEVFRLARSLALLAAAAASIEAIDGVYVDFRDPEGLRREAREAALQGFGGKMTIHPDQIDIVNEAFTPSAEDVAAARRLLEAYEEQRASGRLAFRFEDRMVDAPHLERARRLLARAGEAAPDQARA